MVICVPTLAEVERLAQYFQKELSNSSQSTPVYILHSGKTAKKQKEEWQNILGEKGPLLLVSTPVFASIPRHDIGAYILENEPSAHYKQQAYPYIDAKVFIETMSESIKSDLIYTGSTLSSSVYNDIQNKKVTTLKPVPKTLSFDASCDLIDTTVSRSFAKENKKPFPALSAEVSDTIAEALKNGEKIFLLASRRGIAPQTVCGDCGKTLLCTSCRSTMSLHSSRGKRMFLCHRCGHSADANIRCAHCDSWNMVPLGIGIEQIQAYIKKLFPKASLYTISSDDTTTIKKSRSEYEKFLNEAGGAILLGTQKAIPHIDERVTYSVIVSVDAQLCIPDFKIEEKVFNTITSLKEVTKKRLLVETTDPENKMLNFAKNGEYKDYMKEELTLRKTLHYPPYYLFIRIACIGKKSDVKDAMRTFLTITKEYAPKVFRGYIPKGKMVELDALIRIPADQWPDEKLMAILRSLPFSFSVDIAPNKTL